MLVGRARRDAAKPRRADDEGDFRRLWAGDAVSQVGSQITLFALPYMAVTTLHAAGGQVGVLQALYTLPVLIVPLPLGAWLEGRPRRPVLIAVNLACALLVFSVPAAAALGTLGIGQLYVIALLGGVATVTSDITKVSFIPRLVRPSRLASANSRLNAGAAVGATGGPGIAGWLTGLLGAPYALVVDGLSYLCCTAAVLSLRSREQPAAAPRPERRLRAEIGDGLRAVTAAPPVRNIAIHGALNNGGVQLVSVALVIYLVRVHGFGSSAYGLVLMCGGIGAIAGTLLAPRLIRAVGHGRAMLGTLSVTTSSFWLLPAISGPEVTVVAVSGLALAIASAGTGVGGVVSVTVRQLLTSPELHSRMNASFRLITYGAIPVGALAGGLLVQYVGAREALWIAPAVLTAAVLPLATRPVRSLGPVLDQRP